MSSYDNPNFLLIREDKKSGNLSVASAGTAYNGCTLRTYTSAVILGATVVVGSGGSAAGTSSLSIAILGTSGTAATAQSFSITALTAGDVADLSLSTGLTLASAGVSAALLGNAASLDKILVLKDIIWRYRLLPYDIPAGNLG